MKENFLNTSIDYLKGVGPNRSDILKKEFQIFTYDDLLNFFPFRYIDRTKFYKINEIQKSNADVQIIGRFTDIYYFKNIKSNRLIGAFNDGNQTIEIVWFKATKWIEKSIKLNTDYVLYGKPNWYLNKFSIAHPELDIFSEFKNKKVEGLLPIYSSNERVLSRGITNKFFREVIFNIINTSINFLKENLSTEINEKYSLISKQQAYKNIHFPSNHELLSKAEFRLKYEEFFYLQLEFLMSNISKKSKFKGFNFSKVGDSFNKFYKSHLPFLLTNAQKRVIKEIRKDFSSNAQMNRLLQGDVGSGKTIVALLSSLIAIDNNFQVCFLAPTEILAQQHFNSLNDSLNKINITVNILTGSSTKKDRIKLFSDLISGEINILVGTHAVLEDNVRFKNLGFVIIDEQHKFGVAQRSKLWKKNITPPHVLVMTATPIPRTLAMSVYGDLDISIIDELPPGRKAVKTVHRSDRNRLEIFKFLKDEINKGRQVYVVYPLIEESKKLDYKDLMDGYESISREFPNSKYQISILHGRMKSEDKAIEMKRFKDGETNIMVSTTVIEVGVNIPNASVMVIESSEKFGLSQLHQLRGRVGRGSENSYCILMTSNKLSSDARKRIKTMTSTNDGFKVAEVDMEIRGPGNLLGTQQSGLLNLKLANIITDKEILESARDDVKKIISVDQKLVKVENKLIKEEFHKKTKNTLLWKHIS
ncbi:ATP-dependent DNA helicase RecG [Flavobacteriaceae bacterium]|nr:ATP-dependent DNA helicase RecG [Flavobacteriaceae bacterium]MDB4086501.1 ATP-dependent DNA helicase RecG [Flavobacteriaceae bacterium]MDB9787876.1 ATP-dependent DNA helicase RecG [Flavobacteriaceae bacterium]